MKGAQSFIGTPSNARDKEVEELHRELDETKFAKERLETELRSFRETSENRKRALDDALCKLQEKKQQVEKQTQELNKRAEDMDNANRKCEEIKAILMQKESALRGLNCSHEQLRVQFNETQKSMENEIRELSRALDDANSKCEERERDTKKHIGEIENLRFVISNLQKKCSTTEAISEEKTNRMRQMESELELKGATLAVISENKSHHDILKMKLTECERNLQQESAKRALAQQELEELKSRDMHLLNVEKQHNTVQEQLKWRKEQFGLLEEAYKKLQKQFQDSKYEWEKEKAAMLSEISTLQNNLDTQSRMSKDLHSQLQRCNQALAHEESRRKVLEIQMEESRHGFEKVTAEFDEARSVIESMTEKHGSQVGKMKDSLDFKERQIREMEVQQTLIKQENQELRNMLEEFQASRSGSEDVHSSLESLKMKFTAMEDAYNDYRETMKIKEYQWEKERNDMVKTLNDCQTELQLKGVQVRELESQLEGARESAERLTCQKAELSQQLLKSESQYQEAQSKMSAENFNLESSYKRNNEELACLKEQLEAKQKAFEQIQQELTQHQIIIESMSAKCESLEALEKQCSAMQEQLKGKQEQVQSLVKSHSILQDEIRQKEQSHIEEVQRVRETLEEARACLRAKEQVENENENELRRLKETIERIQASHLASEIKAAEYEHQLQALQQEILAARHALTLSEEKNKTDKESLLDAIMARDRKIGDLNNQLVYLDQSLNEFSQKEETWVQLESQYKQLSDLRIRELESLSVANAKLESISKELLDKEEERDMLQKCLESKEADLGKLKKEIELLIEEKSAIIDSIRVQEGKYKKLAEENEQIKLSLQEAYIKLEDRYSELTDRDSNIGELQKKLQHGDRRCQELSEAVNKIQCLEGLLEEARSCLQDKENKISEFEISAEQFRNEVLVAKLQLAEKEKDEAILQEKLRDAFNEARSKEDQLLEMDSKLNSMSKESEEKQAEILCLKDEIKEMEKRLCESKETQADMEAQLKSVSAVIEKKEAALKAVESEVKRETNSLEDTKEVIEQLKVQLCNEEKASFDRQAEIKYLYKELERKKIEERRALENLKEVQDSLEHLEQDSKSQISKLEGSITELQSELAATRIKMEDIDKALNGANKELALCNEKCTTLEEMLSIKDETLWAKEKEISSLQTDITQQAEIIGQAQLDMQFVQDRLQGEIENRENLEKTVSLYVIQVAELHECKQEIENKLNSIKQDYEAALKTVGDCDVSISCLEEDLRVSKGQLEKFNVVCGNHEQLIGELLQKINLSKCRIEAFEKQAFRFQGALEGAVDNLKEEINEVSFLSHSFDELKSQLAEIKMDTISSLEQGMRYAAEFRDVINVLDNFQVHLDTLQKRESDMASRLLSLEELLEDSKSVSTILAKQIDLLANTVNDSDSQLLEWKDKAFNSAKDAAHIQLELENANQVISDLQRQLGECKSTQDGFKELCSEIEVHENRENCMQSPNFLLDEQIWNSLSDLSDEMDKFSQFYSSMREQDGEVEKLRREFLLNFRELKAILSSVKDQLKGFENLKNQFQLCDMKLQAKEGQLSILQSDMNKEREKANHYAKSMEKVEIDLANWKDKVDIVDFQNKTLQSDVELLKRSLDESRKQKEEVMERESQLQDEITAMHESLKNVSSDFVEGTEKAKSLLYSIKSMEEERKELLEQIRSISEENKITKLELEAAKMELSELTLHDCGGDKDIRNLKLTRDLSAAHGEIQLRKDFVQKLLCQLQNVEMQDMSHQVHLQATLEKIIKNWDMEDTIVYPVDDSKTEGGVRDVMDDNKIAHASQLPSDKIIESKDEYATGGIEVQHVTETKKEVCDIWQRIHGEQAEVKVQVLMKELETALMTLAGQNAAIQNLNKEVENMQVLVKRHEERSTLLEQYKDLSTVDPERYFHYNELCDSLIRDQLRLKKKLEMAERKNQVLVDQIEEFRQSTQARVSLDGSKKDRALNEKQVENMLYTAKPRLQTDVGSGHGSAERSPLHVLNY
ncbi:sporulation-specific protein 15 isoform X2 [Cryptomeria japonica]|uniref:sporulation-specific protein 15 isoform X2 n=1 Tax=Cryptomeria japonica TaxID=3369 RepID=UPI0027DA52E2|nr:sporulation-specific protein 15 isoform X2 [Cryptomeria japonica]